MDLSLVSAQELADELMHRGEVAIVFVGAMGPDRVAYVNWVGDYYKALGLCVDMQRIIQKDSKDE